MAQGGGWDSGKGAAPPGADRTLLRRLRATERAAGVGRGEQPPNNAVGNAIREARQQLGIEEGQTIRRGGRRR